MYIVPTIGDVYKETEEGIYRVMHCQAKNCSQKDITLVKMRKLQQLNEEYAVDINI